MISFNTDICYSSIEIVLKITITEFSCITFIIMVIIIIVNYTFHDVRKDEFILSYFMKMVISIDIFI